MARFTVGPLERNDNEALEVHDEALEVYGYRRRLCRFHGICWMACIDVEVLGCMCHILSLWNG